MMYVKTKERILPVLISLRIDDISMCVPSDSPNCHQSVAKSRDDEEAAKGFDILHMHMRQEESELAKEWQHYPTHEINKIGPTDVSFHVCTCMHFATSKD